MRDLKRVKVLGDLSPVDRFIKTLGTRMVRVTTGEGDLLMEFKGHFIESGYEYFEETCKVTARQDGAEVVLFDENSICTAPYHNETVTTGSKEAVADFVWEHANVPVQVRVA